MCGITGFAAAPDARPPGREVLVAMTEAIRHRGPDDDGFLVEGGVGLGHRRLSIIDVAGGRNPLCDDEGRVAVVFNGELYNHLALRARLEGAGRRPASRSDGEVLVHGYLEWGWRGLLERVRGMFAFALLDRRTGALHLARDPLGIKPLYYAHTPGGLVFGSEIKAILPALGRSPPLDRRGLWEAVCLGFVLSPRTMFEGVHALPPGHALRYADGELQTCRHHELVLRPGSSEADPDALWERLGAAVDSHLMSEVPLGAFLSGGIDSSAVVTAMRGLADGPVEAVCVGILEPGMDERPFAREVAGRLGVTLHEEQARPDLADLLGRLAWHNELPFGDTSSAPTWLVCEGARRHVTVALSGDGGDESFAGYRRTRYDVLEASWRARLPWVARRAVLAPLGRVWPTGRWVPRPLRAGVLLQNLGGDWLDAYVRSMARVAEPRAWALLRPEWHPEAPLRASFEAHAARCETDDPLARVTAMDFRTWLPDDILLKVDRASMAHGLEVRVPLLDTDFVEWAAGLPSDAKLAGGEGKVIFRRALRGRVPDVVLDRPKQGFHLPVDRWLRESLGERLAALVAAPGDPLFEIYDHGTVADAAREHAGGAVDRSTELWGVLSMDAFLRHGPGGRER